MELYGILMPLLDDELKSKTDIDLQTYDALLHVFEAGDSGIRMTDLAQKVVMSKSGLTTLADRLEERGFLQRIPDQEDRRTIRISLTEAGVESFRNAARIHVDGIERHFGSRVDADDADVIIRVLERLQDESREAR